MKKIALIGLISLCGLPLYGMDIRQKAKRLLKVALISDANAKNFTDFAVAHLLDIDTVLYSKHQTHTRFFENRLLNAKKSDLLLKPRIKGMLTTVERYRSNPPQATLLRDRIKETMAEADAAKLATNLAAIKTIIQGKHLNIDRIPYDLAAPKKTIGEVLDDFRRDINTQDQASRARAIVLLDDIRSSRTKTVNIFEELRNLVFDALVDDTTFDILKKNYTGIDVDTVLMEPLTIEEAIQLNPIGAQGKPKGRTIGDELDARSAEPNAHKILGLVRPHRRKETDKFGELLNAYKNDTTKLADLQKWFEEYPFDIDSFSPWDPKQKQKTFGQAINALKDPALTDLFKASRSNVVPKYAQEIADSEAKAYFWKKVLFATAVIGGGLLYYWSGTQKDAQSNKAEQPVVV